MRPVVLRTTRLILDQPTLDDVDLVTEFCQDPVFERFMLTPWPYRRSHAHRFIGTVVPLLWEEDAEYTWALRHEGVFLGLICYRAGVADIGYWLGAAHRGHGYMPEAVAALADWVFTRTDSDIRWECVPGNFASVSVARASGFTYRGEGPSLYRDRLGAKTTAWTGTLAAADSRHPKPGWPVAP